MWIRASFLTVVLLPGLALAESPLPQNPADASNPLELQLQQQQLADDNTEQGSAGVEQTLAPCPDSPNCVSSQAAPDSDHYVAPLQAGDSLFGAIKRLGLVLDDMDNVTWTQETPNHIHAEFKSSLFGFVDDVDLIAGEDGSIQVRSASRTGYWDMGVNRKRVDELRERLATINSKL